MITIHNFLSLLQHLGYTNNQRSILVRYLLHLLVLGHQGLVFSGVFIAKDIDGVGDKESGNTTMVDVQTTLEAFLTCL